MNFENVVQQLLSFEYRPLGGGATQEEIDAAERALGAPLRGGYRLFLERFGWGGVEDFEIFGIGSGVPRYLDLVEVTRSERTEAQPCIPHHLVPIMNNGGGDHACLDTMASPDNPPIVWWRHEDGADQIPQSEAPDFLSWLSKLLVERVSSE